MIKNNKKKGFTLIELIAVIAILVILAAVMLPKFLNYSKEASVSSAVSNGRIVMDQVEIYNAEITGAAVAIGPDTTLANVKAYLTTKPADVKRIYIDPDNFPADFAGAGTVTTQDGSTFASASPTTYGNLVKYVTTKGKSID